MDPHGIRGRGVLGPQPESVVAQVLAGLDVVLVRVGPMELDLLAFIGDRVHAGLVDALAEEVPLGVVAPEEGIQVIVDLGFQRVQVHGLFGEPLA